jgi:SagB-type dehydrogenase family enzyme
MLNWQDTYRLSRFALMRTDGEGFVLESPLNQKQFPVRSISIMRILAALTRPTRLDLLLSSVAEPEREVLRSFLSTCEEARLLTRVREDGLGEDEVGALGHWEFHDLLFHTSTRLGRNRRPIGGTYRLKDRLPPEPALDDYNDLESLALPKPDPTQSYMPFPEVLERRRSEYGKDPLTLNALGPFLYWTCRVTQVNRAGAGTSGNNIVIRKLYPSGGALHPLRIYLAINACEGCIPGLYRYLDREHCLSAVRTSNDAVQRFMNHARLSTGGLAENPPVLFIISARFRRTAWKYESIAYRLVLMEVGVLLQTMYLTATSLGLKGCAIGCGDSDHFSQTVGTDYYAETSVGEFLLGV